MAIDWTAVSRRPIDGQVYLAPWPRVHGGLRDLGVRGEDAAEHLAKEHLERIHLAEGPARSRDARAAAESQREEVLRAQDDIDSNGFMGHTMGHTLWRGFLRVPDPWNPLGLLAPTAGFEPATHGLGNRRSIP